MSRLEAASPSLLRALQGKRIVDIKEIVIEKFGQRSVRLFLDDATVVDIEIKGTPAGYEWHDYLTVTVLGTRQQEQDREVFRG